MTDRVVDTHVLNLRKEVQTGVLEKGVADFYIDWSPDGGKLAFSATHGGDEELWLMEDFLRLVKNTK